MYFDSLQALLVMDGHGAYVWVAYGVTLLVIVFVLTIPVRASKRFLLQLKGELKRAHAAPARQGDR